MVGKLSIDAQGDFEVVMTRTFAAAPPLVFEAHTVPALVKRWFSGPEGWSLVACDIDLREGGIFRYEWRDQGGAEFVSSGTYREVDPPGRLVATERFERESNRGETVNTQDFAAVGDSLTLLTMTILYPSTEARDAALSSNMDAGMAANHARLDALLAGAPIDPGN